jgi:phosphoenolpyruvate synthase/pyruvate phosphate dikinase
VFRAPAEHIEGMRKFIMGQIDQNPNWLIQHAHNVTKETQEILKWVESVKQKSFSSYTEKELAQILRRFWSDNVKIGPRFIMMLWFPIQMENYPQKEKYKKSVEAAISARMQIEKIGPIVDSLTRTISELVCQRNGIEKGLVNYLSFEELIDSLEKGEKIPVAKLKERQKYFLVTKKGIRYEELEKYLHSQGFALRIENILNVNEVKGTSAYPGKVKGIAKIIRNKEQFSHIQKGDILITGMTTPDFVPILQRVAGFVTDEGGVTCHAAIVARELRKPCIIGTKFATQILKDGDTIDVDATNGIVRVLHRA